MPVNNPTLPLNRADQRKLDLLLERTPRGSVLHDAWLLQPAHDDHLYSDPIAALELVNRLRAPGRRARGRGAPGGPLRPVHLVADRRTVRAVQAGRFQPAAPNRGRAAPARLMPPDPARRRLPRRVDPLEAAAAAARSPKPSGPPSPRTSPPGSCRRGCAGRCTPTSSPPAWCSPPSTPTRSGSPRRSPAGSPMSGPPPSSSSGPICARSRTACRPPPPCRASRSTGSPACPAWPTWSPRRVGISASCSSRRTRPAPAGSSPRPPSRACSGCPPRRS
jgi:hypothetical protein